MNLRNSFIRYLYPNIANFLDIKDGLEVVSFGSGPGVFDIDLSCYSNALNLCVWPEDFRYDYRLLHEYSVFLKKGTIIMHVISPLSFAENNYLYFEEFSKKYAHILSKSYVDISKKNYIFERYFTILRYPKKFLKFIFKKNKEQLIVEGTLEEKKIKADKMADGWLKTNPILKNFRDESQALLFDSFFKVNIEDLKKMAKFSKDNEMKYVPIIVPMSKYLKDKFSCEFLENFLYKNIDKAGLSSIVVDFLSDSDFDSLDLYLNGMFLNEEGKKLLMRKIMIIFQKRNL